MRKQRKWETKFRKAGKMTVTEKDLIKGLEGFPIEVVKGMQRRQLEQTGVHHLGVLQEDPASGAHPGVGGFDWSETPEGGEFWAKVISGCKPEQRLVEFRKGYKGLLDKTVTESDLIGDLEGFPIEVVEGMLQRQLDQTGRVDVTVFQESNHTGRYSGGFDWEATPEGWEFWYSVVAERKFHIFSEGYKGPKALQVQDKPALEIPKELLESEEERRRRIQELVFGSWEIKEAKEKTGMTEEQVKVIAYKVARKTYDERETRKPHLKDQLKELGFYPHPITVEIKTPKKETKKVENQHFLFPQVLKALVARVNVALVGPAGSGKTSMVHNAATALDLPFYSKSVSAQTGVHEFFGYQDANGNFVRTLFREAYEHGGVFLVDEFDAGNPNVLAALNQATANGSCAFPDKMVEKHKDFIAVMAGNTYGTGATAEYVGRNKIDAATLDRFVFIEVPYDENFEMALAKNKSWCRKVQQLRARAAKKKVKCIISPRATFNGEALLEAGMDEEFVLKSVVFKNLSEDEIRLLTDGEAGGKTDESWFKAVKKVTTEGVWV